MRDLLSSISVRAVIAVSAGLVGCSDDGVDPPGDADATALDVDTQADSAADSALDALADVPDTRVDTMVDTMAETTPDVTPDSETQAETDTPAMLPEYCRIQFPTELVTLANGAELEVYGVVYAPGITGESGSHQPAIRAAIGVGPSGSMPDAQWSWRDGTFNVYSDNGFGQLANDEYRAPLSAAPGSYAWAWRFALEGQGEAWRYCDEAGSASYDPQLGGELVVTP